MVLSTKILSIFDLKWAKIDKKYKKMLIKCCFSGKYGENLGLFLPCFPVFGEKLIYAPPPGGGASGRNIRRWSGHRPPARAPVNETSKLEVDPPIKRSQLVSQSVSSQAVSTVSIQSAISQLSVRSKYQKNPMSQSSYNGRKHHCGPNLGLDGPNFGRENFSSSKKHH